MNPATLRALFATPAAVVIESMNNPVLLPGGGQVEMLERTVTDESGEHTIHVCHICAGQEYIIYKELS